MQEIKILAAEIMVKAQLASREDEMRMAKSIGLKAAALQKIAYVVNHHLRSILEEMREQLAEKFEESVEKKQENDDDE